MRSPLVKLVLALVAGAVVGSACGDDGDLSGAATSPSAVSSSTSASEDPAITAQLDDETLSVEIFGPSPSYVLSAEVPPGWENLTAADPVGEIDVTNQRWELTGPDNATVAVTVYDVRNTDYDGTGDDEPWPGLSGFTGDQLLPMVGPIGDSEELDVDGFAAFDLLLFDTPPGTIPPEAPMLVVSLDGAFHVTFDAGLPAEMTAAAEEAYSSIVESLAITAS